MRLMIQDPMNWMARYGSDCSSDTIPVHMDVVETSDAYKIMAELPGMEKDDIKVTIHDNLLTISGARKRAEADDKNVIWAERHWGDFSRTFRLADGLDQSQVSADYKNGVLEVTIAKKEETKPKEVQISVA